MFPNVSKKTTATIQVWVSVVLIVLAVVMSFMPIIKVSTLDLKENVSSLLEEENVNLDEIDFDALPDEVELTAPKFISSIFFFTDLISAATDDENKNAMNDFVDDLADDEGVIEDSAVTAFAMISIFSDVLDSDMSNDVFPIIFNIAIASIALLYILIMMLILPLIILIKALIALVHALTSLKDPERSNSKISSKLPGLLSIMFMILLMLCALPQVSLGWGAIAMLIITVVSIVLNTVVIRMPAYRKKDAKYANVVQAISLAGIGGFLLYFFSLINSGILTTFLKGPFFTFSQEFNKLSENNPAVESSYLTDAFLMLFYIVFAFVSVNYITSATRRLSLSAKNGATLLAFPILTLPVFILPTIVKSSTNLSVVVDGETYVSQSSLHLSESSNTALILVLVGIIIMFLAEIAYIVLPLVLCKDMNYYDKREVLSGNPAAPDAESEETNSAEITAEDNNAEEITTDETNADEAAEEATEEATEDAETEEAPADEEITAE